MQVTILVQQFSIVWAVVDQVRTLNVGFKDKSCFSTPAVLILRSDISGNGDCPLSGAFTFISLVNTEKTVHLMCLHFLYLWYIALFEF